MQQSTLTADPAGFAGPAPRAWPLRVVQALAAAVALHALYFAWIHASQLPLDMHAFRQSQTALTALWFMKEGVALAYETPVAGAPWSIPFEFPIYQAIAAGLASLFHWPLPATGRLLSFSFLVATLLPARDLVRTLGLPKQTLLVFSILLLASPMYLYWGRTFLIETTAMFFAVVAVACYARVVRGGGRWPMALMCLAAILSVLQKATTAIPVLLVLSGVQAVFIWNSWRAGDRRVAIRRVLHGLLMFFVPVAVGHAWVQYTDLIKLHNELGRGLTSAELASWNWGTVADRFARDLWIRGVGVRILAKNLGLVVAPVLIIWSARSLPRVPRTVLLLTCALSLLPLLLFPNLHIRHEYYHTGSLVYPLFGAAVAIGWLLEQDALRVRAAVIGLALILLANVAVFHKSYLQQAQAEYTAQNSRDVEVGAILKRELPAASGFVAFGNDWSSTFAYIAERKSFTVPHWFKHYDDVLANPQKYLGATDLGAVVVCDAPSSLPIGEMTASSYAGDRSWAFGEGHGCLIAVKGSGATAPARMTEAALPSGACSGTIEFAGRMQMESGATAWVVNGWIETGAAGPAPGDEVHVVLRDQDGHAQTLRALWTHAADKKPSAFGFSRVLSSKTKAGTYQVEIVRRNREAVSRCGGETGRTVRVD